MGNNSNKIWKIGTNIKRYVDDFKSSDLMKGDSVILTVKDGLLNIKKIGGVNYFLSKNKKDPNTYSQAIRSWISLGLIEEANDRFINSSSEIKDCIFNVNISCDSSKIEDEITANILDTITANSFKYKEDIRFLNGIIFTTILMFEKSNKQKNIEKKIQTINLLLEFFQINDEIEIGDDLNFKDIENYYKWYQKLNVTKNLKFINESYKWVFGEEISTHFVTHEIQKIFTSKDINDFFDENNIINDIANKSGDKKIPSDVIQSKNYTILDFLTIHFVNHYIDQKIVIPVYQRKYTWNEELVISLLDDIWTVENSKVHYIGEVVLYKVNTLISKLIDGQQRLTTLFLILRGIYNTLIISKKKIPMSLHNIFKEDLDGENYITRKFSRVQKSSDFKLFDKIMKGKPVDELSGNMYKNCYAIINYMSTNNIDAQILFDKVMNNTMLVATVDSISSEYELFENLNTKSIKLSTMDLIKNYIFMNMKSEFVNSNEDTLEGLFYEHVISKFDKKTQNIQIDNFIKSLLRLNGEDYKNEKIFTSFKKIIKLKLGNENKIKNYIEAIKFFEWFSDEIDVFLWSSNKGHFEDPNIPTYPFRDILTMLEGRVIYTPLIIKVLKNYDIKNATEKEIEIIRSVLFEIEIYEMRMQVSNYRGQSLSKFIDQKILMQIDNSQIKPNEMKSLFAQDGEGASNNTVPLKKFTNDLANSPISTKTARLIGYRMELWFRFGEKIVLPIYDQDWIVYKKPTLEHIMPQTAKKTWTIDLTEWTDNEYSPKELQEKIKENMNKIGNLMCIEHISNSKLNNSKFIDKKDVYNVERKILNSFQYLGIENQLSSIKETEHFDFEFIQKRSNEISKIAEKIWK